MNKKCTNCYFGDKCACESICSDYSPIEDNSDFDYALVEHNRTEFYKDWTGYIDSFWS